MKKRNEKIKEIEDLIENNRCSRRKFIDSLGKTVALSSIATLGLTSLLSCEKETLGNDDSLNSLKTICTSHECIETFVCPIVPEFLCLDSFTCFDSQCGDGNIFTCNVGEFNCPSSHSHLGGAGS